MDSAQEWVRGPPRGLGECGRAEAVAGLRRLLAASEAPARDASVLPLGVAVVDAALAGGLGLGLLHEFAPAEEADAAAAFGFAAALLARRAALGPSAGAMLLVVSERGPVLDGHGLAALGLPPDRLLLLRVGSPAMALAALEEALRAGGLAAVLGRIETGLDLAASRRLQLAAEAAGPLLVVLRPAEAEQPNAAATRWRIGAARGLRDRFGHLARPRWGVELARCRNGRPGRWLLEWDHAAHRLDLAEGLGDRAAPPGWGARCRA